MPNYKQLIIDKIQKGLYNAFIERQELNLPYNNHQWVANYNRIFSELEKLDGKDGLFVRSFQRHGYKMACIFNTSEKTLYTLCSETRFKSLRSRTSIEAYHFTDAFSLLSCHEGSEKQINLFGDEVEVETKENLVSLLHSLIVNFKDEFDIKEYCILSCRIVHSYCQLYGITGNYMSKSYDVLKEDKSWNDYIVPNFDIVEQNETTSNTIEMPINIKIKDNLNIKIRENKEEYKFQHD